jgi:hypothetical protein
VQPELGQPSGVVVGCQSGGASSVHLVVGTLVLMDPRRSPYAPGVGTRPIVLAGRDDVLERFDVTMSRLEAGRSDVAPLITGSRGMGKTVLLNELVKNAREKGWFVAVDEVIPTATLSALIAVQAHEVLLEMSRRHRVAANVRRVLGILKAFTAVSALGVTLSIDADAVTGPQTQAYSAAICVVSLSK